MKSKILFIITIVMFFIFNACEENFKPEEKINPIELQPYEAQLAYVQDNLKILGKSVLSMAKDPEFREIVYQQIEKRVGGDDNVLIETLSKIKTSNQTTIGARMNGLVNNDGNVEKALDKFRNIEGRDLYPQIYIPFYENVKARRHSNPAAREAVVAEDQILVIYDGNDMGDTNPVYTGYQLNDNGELTESDLEINEEYAMHNEVWVVSLNETIEDINQVENSTASAPSAIIDRMRCSCHKESWIAGASEVNIITIFSANSVSSYLSNEYYGGGPYEGGRIYKFSRSLVNDGVFRTVNFGINGYWDGRPNATYSHSVIFEYDIWPTGKRIAEWDFNGQFLNVEYRSSDSYYTKNSISKLSFSTYTMASGCIAWDGK
jgi:hypothetical protein